MCGAHFVFVFTGAGFHGYDRPLYVSDVTTDFFLGVVRVNGGGEGLSA